MRLEWTEKQRRAVAFLCAAACLLAAGGLGLRVLGIDRPVYRMGYVEIPNRLRADASGRPSGTVVRWMEEAARRAGVRLQWVWAPEGAERALASGRVDLWPYLHFKEAMGPSLFLSRPYLEAELTLLRVQPGARAASGAPVAVPAGEAYRAVARRLFPEAQLMVYDEDPRSLLNRLCGGRMDFALIERTLALRLAEEWPETCGNRSPAFERVHGPELAVSVAAMPGASALASRIRDGLDGWVPGGSARPMESHPADLAGMGRTAAELRRMNRWLWSGLWIVILLSGALVWFSRQMAATNRKLRETVLDRDRLMAEVKNAEAAKSQFVANMSHELCTPMNGIVGAMELLWDTPLEKTQRELVQTASSSSKSLYALIKQLLDFSQLESNQIELEDRPFSIQEVVEALAETHGAAAAAKELAFLLRIDPAAPAWLRGDPRRVRGILDGLLQNAVKFTASGSVRLQLLAPEADSGDSVRIRIADTGVGIPAELQSRIFAAFEQADTSMTRQYGGLGIGLAMALRMARQMDGRISLVSTPDSGSRFTLHLPSSMLCPVPAGQAPFRARRDGRRGQRVVVIHGDREVRESIVETIGATGLRATGLAALPVGGLVGDSISHIFVEESLLERHSPSWPPRVSVILLYPRSSTTRARIPGRASAELASPFLPSEIRHVLRGGTFARGGPASSPAAGKPQSSGLGLHILLVDDSRTNLKIAEQVLGRMGCAVTTAANGSEALTALEHAESAGETFDVVLMDCQMPVLDGYEATRRIRSSNAPYQLIPIIALTAQIGSGERDHCLEAGMSDYITKPLSRQSLWRMLQRHAARNAGSVAGEGSGHCSELRQPRLKMEQCRDTVLS